MSEATPPAADQALPRSFGEYLLLSHLASGGMGDVFLAKLEGIAGVERPCVLKTLREDMADDNEYVARFVEEARITVRLTHKNICQVFDVGRLGRTYYLAMELISGRDLRSLWERGQSTGQPVTEALAVFVVCEVIEALDYAHRKVDAGTGRALGIVHRDISPQNVMVSEEGEVKLIDFGLALSGTRGELTAPNTVMGKMPYMAPEHARGDRVDARADQFSVGVMLYELLVGARYYEGLTSQQLWYQAGMGGYVPARWDRLDPQLTAIIGRSLHPDRDKRFTTCAEMGDALRRYAQLKGFISGARELRELVRHLFAAELELMSRPLRAQPVVTPSRGTPGFEVHHIATTIPGVSLESDSEPVADAPSVRTATVITAEDASARLEPTPALKTTRASARPQGFARLRAPLIAAIVVAAGAAGFLLRGAPADDAEGLRAIPTSVPPTSSTRTSSTPTAAATPESLAPVAQPLAPVVATPAAQAAPAPAEVEEGQASSSAKPPPRARRARPASQRKPKAPRTFADKLQLLKRCEAPCAAPTVAQAKRLLTLTEEETAQTKAAVDSCARRCLR